MNFSKFLFLFSIFIFILLISPTQLFAQASTQASIAEAEVLRIQNTSQINFQTKKTIKNVTLKVLSGSLAGKEFIIQDNVLPTSFNIDYKVGDNVVVTTSKGQDGKDTIYISDVDRIPMLLLLTCLLIVLTVIVARWQGIASILGMGVSFYILATLIIPGILNGSDPLTITFIGSIIIIPVTYYLAHGLNKKTTIAIVGTGITLLLSGGLAYIFTSLTRLSGFASEEATYLQNIGSNINIKSLLLAGMVIGALAVLNDITISQASIVESLYSANNRLSLQELFSHAMKVGRDHVASLINTLVLVYVGASFPLVILFYNTPVPFGLITNQEIIATEIVRTLVSSIGIIAAVPITTYLACIVVRKK
jgi:uncharacterized membrane protein